MASLATKSMFNDILLETFSDQASPSFSTFAQYCVYRQ